MAKKKAAPTTLEQQYQEIFTQVTTKFAPLPDNTSLAQPTPYKVVPTLVTYGAYEKPIAG